MILSLALENVEQKIFTSNEKVILIRMNKRIGVYFRYIFAKYGIYHADTYSPFVSTHFRITFDTHIRSLADVTKPSKQAYRETRVALSARIVSNAKPMFRYGHGRHYRAYN